jgi:hypothetical protein
MKEYLLMGADRSFNEALNKSLKQEAAKAAGRRPAPRQN